MKVLASLWRDKAHIVWQKYLGNRLPEEGTFDCPRKFILRYFDENEFEYLIQNENKTCYKIKNFSKPLDKINKV